MPRPLGCPEAYASRTGQREEADLRQRAAGLLLLAPSGPAKVPTPNEVQWSNSLRRRHDLLARSKRQVGTRR